MTPKNLFPSISPGISRRALFFMPLASAGLLALSARKHHPIPDAAENGSGDTVRIVLFGDDGQRKAVVEVKKIRKTDAEWRAELTSDEYAVTRQSGTERAFTGEYWNNHEHGLYRCVCCGNALFRSEEKFDSGTGWPSFWAPIAKENVKTLNDASYGMDRTEVQCTKCDSHLGHVFNDGPKPTGLRYCMNSASLAFIKLA